MKYFKFLMSLVSFVLMLPLSSCNSNTVTVVKDQNFNKGWRFKKASINNGQEVSLDDSSWRSLDLPHDWAIEGPFSNKHNARTGGLPVTGEAWYRKHFELESIHKDKRISVEFDGAMNNAKIWVNGSYVGGRPYGYIGFEFDITDFVKFDDGNIIAVQLSPEDLSARWYPGAGIYRNVRLKINNPVHIPQYGISITTPSIKDGNAIVQVDTKVKNTGNSSVEVVLETKIKDKQGLVVAREVSSASMEEGTEISLTHDINVDNVTLWEIGNSYLYTAETSIKVGKHIVDAVSNNFGVRSIAFDAEKGFLLNGRVTQLNGVCMHHDQGPLGAAVNYRAKQRQMQIMQSMGVNALRTSHNPPSPEMLQICDELGIVVITEAFDEWKLGKVENGYHKYFDEWHERDLRDMIMRDRNHPSVIMWSIGNEILEQSKKDGWKLAKHLSDICHDQDPTRPTTAGFNYYPAPFKNKLAYQIDVVGMNYWSDKYAEIKKNNPGIILYGSETSSQTSSRGVYHLPIDFLPKKETNHVSSYDAIVGPPWAYAPDIEFDDQEKNPNSLGEFIWTGFDYLGEPTPYGGRDNSTNGYWNDDWPSRSSYFAPVDLCGFPKDRYYLYQSQWTTKPMVHVLPHWNWKGKEGEVIPVYSYTNCDEVELFVNGKSYGRRIKGKDFTMIPSEYHGFKKGMYKSKYRLSWNVPYSPGAIKVVAYKNGNIAAEKEIRTSGKPAKIVLQADREMINADGSDLSFVTVRVVDKDGNLCPLADNLIEFKVTGQGSIAAVGNGDQTSLDSFQEPNRKAFNGLAMLIVKSTEKSGNIKIIATAENLKETTITVQTK